MRRVSLFFLGDERVSGVTTSEEKRTKIRILIFPHFWADEQKSSSATTILVLVHVKSEGKKHKKRAEAILLRAHGKNLAPPPPR